MPQLFFRELRLAESLGINASPSAYAQWCRYCARPLATADDRSTVNDHDMWMSYQLCTSCGWWDLIYREDGMLGNNEEETYYQSVLAEPSQASLDALSNVQLINELHTQVQDLKSLGSRRVEELIAAILRSVFHCQVRLTQQTRDGGYDIIGFDSDNGPFLVEVKHYAEHHKVDVAVVRHLLGVMYVEGVSRGLVVTTSRFTKPARETEAAVRMKAGPMRVNLHDISDILGWLKLGFAQYFDVNILDQALNRVAYAGLERFPRHFTTPGGQKISLGA